MSIIQETSNFEQDLINKQKIESQSVPALQNVSAVAPTNRSQKIIGSYIIGQTIGSGTFSKVKIGTHIQTGEKVAIKILEKEKIVDMADLERVQKEIFILKQLRHPFIIQLYEIIETSKLLFLVMEYAQGGELFDYIIQNQRIEEEEASRIFAQIIAGVEYVHRLKIVHRDLKPENLLITSQNQIKIIDFGLSNVYKKDELLRTACGSPCYAAPEMILGNKYLGLGVDIWSCGVILFALVTGYLPFKDADTQNTYKKIAAADFQIPKHVSKTCSDLIKRILTADPENRITIEGIRQHPWIKSTSEEIQENRCAGLIIGTNKIPIDEDIINQMGNLKLNMIQARLSIEGNKHNQLSTTYYLLLQKKLREGHTSNADISSKEFISEIIQKPETKDTSHIKRIEKQKDDQTSKASTTKQDAQLRIRIIHKDLELAPIIQNSILNQRRHTSKEKKRVSSVSSSRDQQQQESPKENRAALTQTQNSRLSNIMILRKNKNTESSDNSDLSMYQNNLITQRNFKQQGYHGFNQTQRDSSQFSSSSARTPRSISNLKTRSANSTESSKVENYSNHIHSLNVGTTAPSGGTHFGTTQTILATNSSAAAAGSSITSTGTASQPKNQQNQQSTTNQQNSQQVNPTPPTSSPRSSRYHSRLRQNINGNDSVHLSTQDTIQQSQFAEGQNAGSSKTTRNSYLPKQEVQSQPSTSMQTRQINIFNTTGSNQETPATQTSFSQAQTPITVNSMQTRARIHMRHISNVNAPRRQIGSVYEQYRSKSNEPFNNNASENSEIINNNNNNNNLNQGSSVVGNGIDSLNNSIYSTFTMNNSVITGAGVADHIPQQRFKGRTNFNVLHGHNSSLAQNWQAQFNNQVKQQQQQASQNNHPHHLHQNANAHPNESRNSSITGVIGSPAAAAAIAAATSAYAKQSVFNQTLGYNSQFNYFSQQQHGGATKSKLQSIIGDQHQQYLAGQNSNRGGGDTSIQFDHRISHGQSPIKGKIASNSPSNSKQDASPPKNQSSINASALRNNQEIIDLPQTHLFNHSSGRKRAAASVSVSSSQQQ